MTFWDDGFRLLRRYLPWGGLRPGSWAVRCPLSTTGGGTTRRLLCLLCCWLPLDPTGLPRAANDFFQATWILRFLLFATFWVHKIHQDDGWTIFIQVFAEQKGPFNNKFHPPKKCVASFFSGWPLGNDGMDPPKNQRLDPPYEGMRFDSVEVRGSPVTTVVTWGFLILRAYYSHAIAWFPSFFTFWCPASFGFFTIDGLPIPFKVG